MKRCLLLLPLIAASPASAEQPLTVVLGKFTQEGDRLRQVLSVTNQGGQSYRSVVVECGFFGQNQLLAAASTILQNLGPSATGYGSADMYSDSDQKVDRVACRVSDAR